jgi:hypothetical protein
MKLIATHTIHNGPDVVAPGQEFDVADKEEAARLIKIGVAEKKTRTVDASQSEDNDEGEGERADGGKDLEDMTRAELEAVAAERSIDTSSARSKADVLALLKG